MLTADSSTASSPTPTTSSGSRTDSRSGHPSAAHVTADDAEMGSLRRRHAAPGLKPDAGPATTRTLRLGRPNCSTLRLDRRSTCRQRVRSRLTDLQTSRPRERLDAASQAGCSCRRKGTSPSRGSSRDDAPDAGSLDNRASRAVLRFEMRVLLFCSSAACCLRPAHLQPAGGRVYLPRGPCPFLIIASAPGRFTA